MSNAIIRLVYRHQVAFESSSDFDKLVFEDSFQELLLQSQVYNPGSLYKTFQELTASNPKAHSLHYKTGFAIGLYVKSLGNKIPVITDTLGEPISFEEHRFRILDSSFTDKKNHRVAIDFVSAPFQFFREMGGCLLLAPLGEIAGNEIETFLLPVQSGLSIISYKEVMLEESVSS